MWPPESKKKASVVIYFLRQDLRLEDNPVFHALATNPEHKFDHLLPVYVFPAQQIEVSGFIPTESHEKSPYPEAKSEIGRFWRCGPHRAKFIAGSVWALKESLESVGSGLNLRVGLLQDTLNYLLKGFHDKDVTVKAVWMTHMLGNDETKEEKDCKLACKEAGVDFKIWKDEKYLIDDDDINKRFSDPKDLPDVFTSWRKMVEPLRDNVREVLAAPTTNSLPPLPPSATIPEQPLPFIIPTTQFALEEAVLLPVIVSPGIKNPPSSPEPLNSAHVYKGGTKCAMERVEHLLKSGSMTNYKATRNGLLGLDFSTKLSAWLSLGCITARQVHAEMYAFEEGTSLNPDFPLAKGWGKGENDGTKAVRFELAWRDYMRLCHKKFGDRISKLGGFKQTDSYDWKKISDMGVRHEIDRFLNGTTGMGLIDASQRELYLTGYTSNRARQNVASYLAKHLGIDWRIGAEWYENMLIDHDVSSNWGNWQYVAGIGNDPRSTSRVFNSVKQAADYDAKGEYIYHWIPEFQKDKHGQKTILAEHEDEEEKKQFCEGYRREEPVKILPSEVFRGYTMDDEKQHRMGLDVVEWVTNPLIKIDYTPGKLISKPGQRERWRTRQEELREDEERRRNGQLPRVKPHQKRNLTGKADHRDGDGRGRNGGGRGPGGGAGGGAPPSGGPSGGGSSNGNGHFNGTGANGRGNSQQRNGSNGRGDGNGRCTQQNHDGQRRGSNGGAHNNSNGNANSNSGQQPRHEYANNGGGSGPGGYKGRVPNGLSGRHRRMIYPPPGLPPRNFDPTEARPAAFAPLPQQWGHPMAVSAAHCGVPPGLLAPGVPPERMNGHPPGMPGPGIMSPDQLMNPQSPYGPAHPHYTHYPGPHPIQHQWPQWMGAQLAQQRMYRNFANGGHEGPEGPVRGYMGKAGYTADTGVMDLSRTMGRMELRQQAMLVQQMSWRQPD